MTTISQPTYDPSELSVGVVHIGVGNFHRAHQAMYFDRLFERGLGQTWGICGVGLTPHDIGVRDALESQGMRYTLVARSSDGAMEARSVASILEVLCAPGDREGAIERLANPSTRMVSLTITEGGYGINDATGEFDVEDELVVADARRGSAPHSVFGVVVEALRRRREAGRPAFTVVSCDNLAGNGAVAEHSFSSFAALRDPDLAAWIRAEVPFPNSMVDRITPATGEAERQLVFDSYGVRDAWPVVCESFSQWVLEDRFASGRPPLEAVGVQVVSDVEPYEKMKLRLLNGSHQAFAYFAYLMGYRYAHDAIADPNIAAFVRAYMRSEAESTVGSVPGVDLDEYEETLMSRFANPSVRDTLLRLASDASDRIPKFVVPVALERAARGLASPLAAAVLASWAAFARGLDEDGEPIEVPDRQAERVARAVARQQDDPIGFLRDPRLFADLAASPVFAESFERTYQDVMTVGARKALGRVLETTLPRGADR